MLCREIVTVFVRIVQNTEIHIVCVCVCVCVCGGEMQIFSGKHGDMYSNL